MTQIQSGAQLLTDISFFITRFVSLSRTQADVCALWTVHTHTIDATDFTPYLNPQSPVKRSGKTRLLEVERMLVKKPWFTGRVTASALVRKTHLEHPTLLLDESDTAFQADRDYSEALRGILNSGFERDGTYSMSVPAGNDWKPHDFSTFSPKMIAGIGRLPSTIEDRSIPIRLKRARREEQRERFRKLKIRPEAAQLRVKIEEWAASNIDALRKTEPQLPDELNDRQQDVCEPLIAIAELAGGEWPTQARAALVTLCTGNTIADDSPSVQLLSDIRMIFARDNLVRISTSDLLDQLGEIEEAPWASFESGRPLNAFRLSRLLIAFDVRPRDVRFNDTVLKGYLRTDFQEGWDRYLEPLAPNPAQEGQQGLQPCVYTAPRRLCEGQREPLVADRKDAK